jgi:purine-nucleoside phosphorylase
MGISFITNLAAGLSQNPLSHTEVIEIADQNLPMFKRLLRQIIVTLDLAASQ